MIPPIHSQISEARTRSMCPFGPTGLDKDMENKAVPID